MTTTLRDQLKQAIYGQESSHGKADTSQENYAGARGPMQVTRSTFDGLKNKGLIPKDFDHANPEHTMQAGNALIDHLADKFGDDPRKVAAAYYAGEKAIRKDGSIADFRDLKNPKAPTTLQYVEQVLGRMGMKTDAEGQPVTPSSERYDISNWRATPMPGPLTPKLTRGDLSHGPKPSEVIAPSDTFTPPKGDDYTQQIDAETARLAALQKERDDSSFIDKAGTSLFHNGLLGSILKSHYLNDGFERVEGYNPRIADKAMYEGKTEDEQILLDSAVSPDHAKRLAWSIEEHREAQRQIGLSGPYVAFAAQIAGGLPEGAISGVGAAMASVKTLQAAGIAMKTRRAAVAASALENVVGNVAMTAAQDYYDPYIGIGDYAMAFGLGAAVTAPSLKFRPAVHGIDALGQKIMADAAVQIDTLRTKAKANLPLDATPEQVAAEMRRLEATSLRDDIQGALAPLGRDRQLLPDMEKAEAEVTSAKEVDDFPTIDMDWAPPANSVTGKPINDPASIVIGNAGMLNPWNRMSEADLKVARTLPQNKATIEATVGMKLEEMDAKRAGVHVPEAYAADVPREAVETLTWLHRKFLPEAKLFLRNADAGSQSLGDALRTGVGQGALRIDFSKPSWSRTLVHEFGHVLMTEKLAKASPEIQSALTRFHARWIDEYTGRQRPVRNDGMAAVADREIVALKRSPLDDAARMGRGGVPEPKGQDASLFDVLAGYVGPNGEALKPSAEKVAGAKAYWPNFDEMGAEQFSKYIEAALAGEGPWKPLDVPKPLVQYLKDVWQSLVHLFQFAKTRGYLQADESFQSFFESIRKEARASETKRLRGLAGLDPYRSSAEAPASATATASMPVPEATARISAYDPIAEKYGLTLLPQETPAQRAEANAILHLYRKADEWAKTNPIDEARLKSLTDNSVFNVASTSLLMLKSKNPVVRMIASELLESPSGAAGRRSTAAISKYMNERKFMGNSINELQSYYTTWRNAQGGNVVGDFWDGKLWQQFNRQVAEQIESRRAGGTPVSAPDEVMKAATMLEQAYDRMRLAQIESKTNGWAALPETSVGYMPHKMSPEKVRNMTNAQEQVLHSALVDQFISIEGFDISFSANLASKYIDRVKRRALGGFDAPVHLHQTGAADIVEDALTASGLSRDEVRATMQRFRQGAAQHTKKRLNLDLTAPHDDGNGGVFRLLDLYETDQLKLLRSQAQRVSGEVALARHGIQGKPGLAILREAMKFGEDGAKVEVKELEAFDQVSAEFLGEPFGNQGGMWLNRATQVNSLARLGGMGFTQLAEVINALPTIGFARAADAVLGMKRLRDEAKALARGEKVDNGILSSIEAYGGAQFGTDSYKMVFPFDNGDLAYQTYGKDTLTFADRALRGGTYLQGKLSFWRSIHAAQQRGMAEQIVHKAVRYIREGGTDTALADMGIDAVMAKYLQSELPHIAKFEGDRLVEFDITKVRDPEMAQAFVQAVHRGTSQIIQGTFIGETGKWAHDGLLRMMTQFRSFGITSIEKQWARQVNNYGLAAYLGIILGSMSLAAPIYYARTLLAAAGKEESEREKYLEKQLSFAQMARASMNYVAGTGLAGDMLDALTAVTGVGQVTGGRTAAGSQFVGNVVAPAAGLADDLWRGIQNTKEGTDPHDLLKSLPFSRLPGALPVMDALAR